MVTNKHLYTLLADAVLIIHFAFVAFVVLGFVVIWIGYFRRWSFVCDLRFRLVHAAAMGFVLVESLTGIVCPLTIWENDLRIKAGNEVAYSGSFIQHWFSNLLFHDWSEQTFTVIYSVLFVFVALTFWIVRPRLPRRS